MYDSIVIGCGFAGAVIARELAEKSNKKVLILEQRNHIGGNCYDARDEYGILVHEYGPHIFHTNSEEVYSYLSRFTEWFDYAHEVVGNVHGLIIPIPFNLNTLQIVYGEEKAKYLSEQLIKTYGMGARVPILTLMNSEDEDIRGIANYVYENIFLHYTMKQWGQKPEEVDASVTSRVPVLISYDNRYFQDKYQGMPRDGYTRLFENMLAHENITIQCNTNAKDVLKPYYEQSILKGFLVNDEPFTGDIIFTGAIDEFFDCCYGRLPYRSLKFLMEHYDKDYYQSHGVVNYTVSEDYTRITEFKYLTNQKDDKGTTIMKEYPMPYQGLEGEVPYYAIINEDNKELYNRYVNLTEGVPNFHLLGRLAEYQYYNIDSIVLKALELAKNMNREDE